MTFGVAHGMLEIIGLRFSVHKRGGGVLARIPMASITCSHSCMQEEGILELPTASVICVHF